MNRFTVAATKPKPPVAATKPKPRPHQLGWSDLEEGVQEQILRHIPIIEEGSLQTMV
jgi:hypothetical protein